MREKDLFFILFFYFFENKKIASTQQSEASIPIKNSVCSYFSVLLVSEEREVSSEARNVKQELKKRSLAWKQPGHFDINSTFLLRMLKKGGSVAQW